MSTVLWADYLAFMETGSAELFDDLVEKSVAVAGEQYNAWPLWKNYLDLLGQKGQMEEQVRVFKSVLKNPMRSLLQAKEAADALLDQVPSDERALLAEALNAAYEEGQEKKQDIQDF